MTLRRAAWITTNFVMLLTLTQIARADCNDATSHYNSAISDVETYVKRYFRCVAGSNGNDDCSSEFRRLKNAHSDFESAVSDYQIECRR
jgi:hypothetical protein